MLNGRGQYRRGQLSWAKGVEDGDGVAKTNLTAIKNALGRTRREGRALELLIVVAAWSVAVSLVAAFAPAGLANDTVRTVTVVAVVAAAALVVASVFVFRRWTALRAARVLESENPSLEQSLLAYVSTRPTELRPQLARWIAARPLRMRQARLGWMAAIASAISVALGLAVLKMPLARPDGVRSSREKPLALVSPSQPGFPFTVGIRIEPPAYTGLAAHEVPIPDGAPIRVPSGSRVALLFTASGSEARELVLNSPGRPSERLRLGNGAGVTRTFEVRGDLALRFENGAPKDVTAGTLLAPVRLLLFHAVPDHAPDLELLSPAADASLNASPAPMRVQAIATDDFGIAAASLNYTLAHGRGEGMTFKNGRLPAKPNGEGRSVRLEAPLDPKALGFGIGDTLVLWAEASDRNDMTGPGLGRSAPRVIRWEDAASTLDLSSSAPALLPKDAPLSERELMKRTQSVVDSKLSPAVRRDKAIDLASDQRSIRERFAVFTRAESAGSAMLDVETEETNPLGPPKEERLLAKAVDAMWRAERALSSGDARAALPAEKEAAGLLDDAFGRERARLSALAAPKAPVDLRKRLTGDAKALNPEAGPATRDPAEEALRASLRNLAGFLDEQGVAKHPSGRIMGDQVFQSPAMPGFDPASQAAAFYAARNDAEARSAARREVRMLLLLLNGEPAVSLAVDASEAAIMSRLEAVRQR